ncbi:hypothetical protein CHELA40_13214 [Chelatococcus asaccharovorans]|nr:hypothetical protein CHELA40_13214 [Chelatococcus asaccharovorans]
MISRLERPASHRRSTGRPSLAMAGLAMAGLAGDGVGRCKAPDPMQLSRHNSRAGEAL